MGKRYIQQKMKAIEVDRENYRIYFVFSTGAVDRHGEVIDQNGWDLKNYNQNPVVLWGHDQREFPIGKGEDVKVVDGQLGGWVRFAYTQNPKAAIVFELCADQFLNAGSVGFINKKWMYDEETDTLTLLENELFEYSIVNVPANPEALSKACERAKSMNVEITEVEMKEFEETLTGFEKEKNINRFKDLGVQVPFDKSRVVKQVEEEDEEETEVEEDTKVEKKDEVKEAIEVLLKAGPTKIKEVVGELTSKIESKDVNKKAKVEKTPVEQDHKNRKTFSVNEINRVIRSLMSASK